jgi:predicted transposase YbfD/YdcC
MDIAIVEMFSKVKDPRVKNRCHYKLEEVLFISICALISNGEDYEDMAEFGKQRIDWLRQYLSLANGVPSSDTFNRVLQLIKPSELSKCLQEHGLSLFNCLSSGLAGKLISFDGKKIRGENPKSRGNNGLYILSAWVNEYRITIGERRVEDKSNEITAIPSLLDEIADDLLKNSRISIDAIGCQKDIVTQIVEKRANYLLAVKGNQKSLKEEIEDGFKWRKSNEFNEEWEYDHGRYEVRKCEILSAKDILHPNTRVDWAKIETLIKITANRTINDVTQTQTRYYISNESLLANEYNQNVRGHWSIENQLHWHLDVTFDEDACRARSGHALENLNILRKFALLKLKQRKDKISLKKRRFRASMNTEYLEKVLDLK